MAHFEPEVISLIGEASYPQLSLSVPRPILTHPNEAYNKALKCLKENSKKTKVIDNNVLLTHYIKLILYMI